MNDLRLNVAGTGIAVMTIVLGIMFGLIGNAKATTCGYHLVGTFYTTQCGNLGGKAEIYRNYYDPYTCPAIGGATTKGKWKYAFMNTGSSGVACEVFLLNKWDAGDSSTWEWLKLVNGVLAPDTDGTPTRIWSGTLQPNVAVIKDYPAYIYGHTLPYPDPTSGYPDQFIIVFDYNINGTLDLDCLSIAYPQ